MPDSLLKPLVDNNVIGVIICRRRLRHRAPPSPRDQAVRPSADWVDLGFDAVVAVLHWVIALVPLAVFGMVAADRRHASGFAPFARWARSSARSSWGCSSRRRGISRGSTSAPGSARSNCSAAAATPWLMAFSTDSSTATMPVTYACLKDKVGLRDESARMGALIGTNFNNDGTALYEAMSALFIAQLVGRHLSLGQQLVVMLMSIVASVGAAGIPEAGTVTMLLVFTAVEPARRNTWRCCSRLTGSWTAAARWST